MENIKLVKVDNIKRSKSGVVVSVKNAKTIVVKVERLVKHHLYGKIIRVHSKIMAHDELGVCKLDDLVRLVESRPLSKCKRWRLDSVLSSTN